ncbi:MAG: TPM domain-containing protein [Candidatus Aenigmarchaeota archaeon]|nr:TPM domain-containing protein [Candidatus Aenigmarchaeota archaeon]
MRYIPVIAIFVAIIIVVPAFAAHLPKPAGYVNDFAGILTDTQTLENELILYEQNTTIEIAVVTIDGLPEDQTLFSYGVELFQEWGIGKSDDNGILVLMVKNGTTGNRLRIELGYGIQGYITGAEAGQILDNALPYYEQGDYQLATEIILNGLSEELVNYVPDKSAQDNGVADRIVDIIGILPIFVFFIIIIVSIALRNRCPYCFGRLKCKDGVCVCKKCGRKVDKRGRYAPVLMAGGFGGGGGGGGFGGGGSGGGGAGR